MVFENNWVVPVLHDGPMKRTMLDPTLKVQLWVTEPRQDPGEQLYELQVHYDPHMDSQQLVAEMSAKEIADGYFRVVPERPMKLIQSSEMRKILNILFVEKIAKNAQGEIELWLASEDFGNGFEADASLLKKAKVPFISDDPYAFILHALQSYGRPQYWDDRIRRRNANRAPDDQITRITVLLGEMMASQIAQATGKSLPSPNNGFVTISTRALRA